ncbi:MAG: PAS domain S-box protein [Desmonostoc vinosum HA7617-LM4]|jgi:PAS domain S-box-containing protein|nr:PAS domain S-box protein [Desmonostoc vinosum HA7617-LM4]
MKKLSEKFVVGGFSLALVLLCSAGAVSYLSIQRLAQEKQWVIHTHQVLESLDHMYIGLSNAESAQSSYILTGKLNHQRIYFEGKQKVYQEIQALRTLTIDNYHQQNRLNTLQPLIVQQFALLEQSIKLFEQTGLAKLSQITISEQGITIRQQIQAIRQTMDDEEQALLQERTASTDTRFYQIIIVISLVYVLSFVLLMMVYLLLQKQIRINKALSQEAIRLEQQAAKAKLADILETITDAFVALDCDSCYTYVNQKAGQLLNRRPEDMIGKNIWELFPEAVGEQFYQSYCQAVAKQQVIRIEAYYSTWERWFENCFYPSSEGLSIFFQDITSSKLAEIALEENERRYRSLVVATSQAVWIADASGMPRDFDSWKTLTGQSDGEIQGRGWLDAIHPQEQNLTKLLWTEALATKNLYQAEHRVRVADGSYRFFAARAVPVFDANHEIQEWVGTYTDITDRKLAEQALKQTKVELEIKVHERTAELQKLNEELKRSNQELEQFAYVASHDLQEPLRAVTGYTQLLEQEYRHKLDDSAQEYFAYIVDGAKRMQRLIQDLLAYSRVGTRGQQFTSVDCNSALNSALSNLHVAIAESQAIITHEPLPKLFADKTQLVQLFQNLIGNAIKFCRETPQIHIGVVKGDGKNSCDLLVSTRLKSSILHQYEHSYTPCENEWLFWVQDNGIGIKPQYLERIFDVFRRLHTRREFSGTGIGLAICKKIVERHGGRIWAESQPTVGTIFYLTLNHN